MAGLQNRVALISGALRGIGLSIAERYVAEGAEVILTDLSQTSDPLVSHTLQRLGSAASYFKLDVAQEADWRAAEHSARARYGRLDILVNNAGTDFNGAVESIELAAWKRIMSINLDGVFLGTKTFTALLAESGAKTPFGSSIINVSSILGLVGYSETSAYNASKGAVRLFTKSVAVEYATKRKPIRVNSLHPGFVKTPLLDSGMQKWVESGMAAKAQDLMDALAAATPNGRIADPAEIAGAAFFLASDDSSFCTGSELIVDGGWTAR